jgi:CDP-diacylglycerol--glycerol-3-phosphate 3-phosphatidyltransferase
VSDRVLTLPNVLSALRLVGVPVFLWLLFTHQDSWAFVVLALSGLTDYLDGKIARRFNLVSRVGQLLDPLADRLYVLTTLVALAIRDIIPLWLLIVLVGRGLVEAQKYWIARVRPDLQPHLVVVKTQSFPSGHATSSMIFYLTVALVLTAGTRWSRVAAAIAILLSLLIGTSRVMLGVHWPSDVIGGWAFGLLWVLLTLRLAERTLRADTGRARTAL